MRSSDVYRLRSVRMREREGATNSTVCAVATQAQSRESSLDAADLQLESIPCYCYCWIHLCCVWVWVKFRLESAI